MELQLDFSSCLPQHLTPKFDKVVSLLTQTVPQWPHGSAMLTKENRGGVYTIKVWDKSKGEKLIGKKIDFHYNGEISADKVTVRIKEKPQTLRYKNPKYVTMTSFNRFPAENMTNEQIDKILQNGGTLIVPTQDVYAEYF